MKKRRENENIEIKKKWKERVLRETAVIERKQYNMFLKKVMELESVIARKGLETPTLRRLFEHTKQRFGLTESDAMDLIQIIRNILEDMDDIATIEEIRFRLTKEGREISLFDLEKTLLRLSESGVVHVTHGIISLKRPSDTQLAIKILDTVKKRKKATFSDLIQVTARSEKVIRVIVDDLIKLGLVVVDEVKGEIIYV